MKKLFLTLTSLTVLYSNCMDNFVNTLLGVQLVTTSVTTNAIGDRTYTTEYPFTKKCGLVRVIDDLRLAQSSDNNKLEIILDRHNEKKVIISATFAKKIANIVDEGIKNKDYEKIGLVWVPWSDDTMSNQGLCMRPQKKAQPRGGNRLFLTLRNYGAYHIQIPNDADIEVGVVEGDIDYKSKSDTKLYVDALKVNRPGNSGGDGERSQWHYHWYHQETVPLTELITKTGRVNVPNR